MNPETKIQNEIRAGLAPYGVTFRTNVGKFLLADGRTISIGVPGMSDLLFIEHGTGRAGWIEVKTKTGRPSQLQLHFIETMQKIGCYAGIARSVDDALRIIEKGE